MPQLSWYDSLDPKLTERLLRPSVQPGVIDRRLVNSIFARSQWFNSRLSLLNHLTNRQSRETIGADPVPIVYAQPVLQPTGATSSTASPSLTSLPSTSSSSESSPSSLSSLPLLAPGNNVSPTPLPANQPTIVQAKFIDSTNQSQFNPTSTVNPTSISNLTSISNSTSVFSNSTSEYPDVNQQSVSQDLTDLPLTYPSLNASPDIQQNTQLPQQPTPAIATNQPNLANTSATDLPILQIQRPQSIAASNPDVNAQPVLLPASATSSSESSPSSLSSLPLLAPGNNVSPTPLPANQPTIVQAKFIDSTNQSQFNPTSTVNPTSISNLTSISNSTSVFSNSTSEYPDVNQQSVSQDLTDLPLTYPSLNASPDIQQNTQLTQQPTPAIATNQPDLANTSATDLPILQIQRPQSGATSNPNVITDRRRSQRVDRIPPLPPLHRLPNSMEASPSAEITPPVQIQRKLDREQVTSQPVQTPQIVSEPVPLVYAQPMQQESNLSSLPNLQPDQLPAVQRVTLARRSQSSSGQISSRSQSPVMHPGVEPLQALTNALLVVQPSVAQPVARFDRSMIYSRTPVSSRSSDWVPPGSSPSIRAIATSHLTPNSAQVNSFDPGQEFNRAYTVTNEQSASHQQTITPQQSVAPQQPAIDIDTLTEKIQRKLLRQLTVESERRGHSSWR